MNSPSMTRFAFLVTVIASATLAVLTGCDRIGGRSIIVDFRDAEGVRGGDAVYLAGVKIGQVTDQPAIANGRARVPVLIGRKHKDGVPQGSVFLLKIDPADSTRKCLVAYFLVSPAPSTGGSAAHYAGASNRAELVLMLSADKAAKLWEELIK